MNAGISPDGELAINASLPRAANEGRLNAILHAAVDAIISIDEQGIVHLVNPAAERMFGYSAQEMVGKNVSQLMPLPFCDEHDTYLAHYLATGEKKIIGIGREVIGRKKDGTTFPMDLSVAEAALGQDRIFVGMVRDISQRKRSEELLRRVVESTPNALVMVDAAGRMVLVNSQAEKYFGYKREELIGQSVEMLVPDRFRGLHDGYRASFFAAPSARPMGAGRNLHGRRKDGSEFPVEIGLTPVQTDEGMFVLGAIVDITERIRAQAALSESHEHLEKTVAELKAKNDEVRTVTQQLWQSAKLASVGELAASIAHELNNPLGTVTLRIESLLEQTPEGDPRRRALDIVEQETKRMGTLVSNLLQFCRRGEGHISTVDLLQEISQAVDLVHHHLRKHQIHCLLQLAEATPHIHTDRQKLRQVFMNLLTNASDAMPHGGTLTVSSGAAQFDNGKRGAFIQFADTGIGIPPEQVERVFDPFFTTKDEGKGTGLGLAICRRIVEENHGNISLVSELGKGTTVRIVLPLQNGDNANHLRRAERLQQPS